MILWTIGHSNSTIESLIGRLRQNGVSFVIDVRSNPASRFQHFNRRPLERALANARVSYFYLGDLLGGKPDSPSSQTPWQQGSINPALIKSLRESDRWKRGLMEVGRLISEQAANDATGCLLCSESDPSHCHRSFVALDLANMVEGLTVRHIGRNTDVASREVGLQQPLL